MAFANQAAAALENARLFQEQSSRSKIIEALADIANEIATTRDVPAALDQITQRALDLLNANNVAIYLVQDDNVTLRTVRRAWPISQGNPVIHRQSRGRDDRQCLS